MSDNPNEAAEFHRALIEVLKQKSPQSRVKIILESYLKTTEADQELREHFFSWLLNPENQREKCTQLRRKFYEIMESATVPEAAGINPKTTRTRLEEARKTREAAERRSAKRTTKPGRQKRYEISDLDK